MPSTIAYLTSMWLPNAPASRMRSTWSTPMCSISTERPHTRRLGKLYRAYVVLRDAHRRATVRAAEEIVGEGPSVRVNAGIACGETAVDDAVVPTAPARYISAITSMMPEPQIPVTPVAAVAEAKPGSFDQRSQPITCARLERLPIDAHALDRARRGALAAADLACPRTRGPSAEQASRRLWLPRTISAFSVPTSTSSVTSSERESGCSASTTPAASAPTWPAMHGST